MTSRWSRLAVSAGLAVVGALIVATTPAAGQASKSRPFVGGCPSVSARFHPCALAKAKMFVPPRLPDGTPDMQGVWAAPLAQGFQNIEDYPGNPSPGGFGPAITVIVDPADGKVPYHAWARAQRDENVNGYIDPYAQCLPAGVPRQMGNFRTRQITQSKDHITIVNEAGGHVFRVVHMDGRPHVGPAIKLWMGDSLGRWEGTTLVIDTTNFNGRWWFDSGGHFASDALRVVERLTMIDADTIHYQATMEDPQVYTRPWTMAFALEREKEPGYEQLEEACHEGDRDAEHFLLAGYKLFQGPRFPR